MANENGKKLVEDIVKRMTAHDNPEGILSLYTACVRLEDKRQLIEGVPVEDLKQALKELIIQRMN